MFRKSIRTSAQKRRDWVKGRRWCHLDHEPEERMFGSRRDVRRAEAEYRDWLRELGYTRPSRGARPDYEEGGTGRSPV